MDIIGKKTIYFLISGILTVVSIISLVFFGLNLAIEFTGGSRLALDHKSNTKITQEKVEQIAQKYNASVYKIREVDADTVLIRTTPIDQKTKNNIVADLKKSYPEVAEASFETVGPTIGEETERNALKAILIASLAILVYIAFVFRQVSRPVASWKFGVAAIIALLHDVVVIVGVFSLLGKFLDVEIDPLFITAVLTIMGFSVHDTIVVFDRIRENIKKTTGVPFDRVVNNAVIETLSRSLNTSLTVLFVLLALILFGGESIKWFVVALFIGVAVGTYSSIFTASPLLVLWHEWDKRKGKK